MSFEYRIVVYAFLFRSDNKVFDQDHAVDFEFDRFSFDFSIKLSLFAARCWERVLDITCCWSDLGLSKWREIMNFKINYNWSHSQSFETNS